MKKVSLTLLTVCFLLSTQNSFAQAKKEQPKKATVTKQVAKKAAKKELSQEEMMKAWQEYSTPTEVHKMIAQSDGDWTGTASHWMAPKTEATVSDFKCNNKMVLGGRYQVSEFKGSFMGMPFEGIGTLAYDNAKKMFVTTWIDNMGSGLMCLYGTWNKEKNQIEFKGKMVDPMSGGDVEVREVFKMIDNNTQILEMYAPSPDGVGEFKTMELKFTK
jgi:Protein of unknown function (DUF1579)